MRVNELVKHTRSVERLLLACLLSLCWVVNSAVLNVTILTRMLPNLQFHAIAGRRTLTMSHLAFTCVAHWHASGEDHISKGPVTIINNFRDERTCSSTGYRIGLQGNYPSCRRPEDPGTVAWWSISMWLSEQHHPITSVDQRVTQPGQCRACHPQRWTYYFIHSWPFPFAFLVVNT